MKIRTVVAGLVLAAAIAPAAAAAPKTTEPTPVVSTSTAVGTDSVFCIVFPWLPMCYQR